MKITGKWIDQKWVPPVNGRRKRGYWLCTVESAKPRPRRRAKPFGRWSVVKSSGFSTGITYDGKAVLGLIVGLQIDRSDDVVAALNRARVVLKRGRS